MRCRIFRPGPEHHTDTGRPAVFLAGPIQGAEDWQGRAITLLAGIDADVFCPRSLGTVPSYEEQVSWERAHLDRAGRHGVVMFWLSRPERLAWGARMRVLLTGVPTRPHAQTSRLELGWELARNLLAAPAHGADGSVVVGMEDGFSNERFIRRLVEKEARMGPVHRSLVETCRAVHDRIERRAAAA